MYTFGSTFTFQSCNILGCGLSAVASQIFRGWGTDRCRGEKPPRSVDSRPPYSWTHAATARAAVLTTATHPNGNPNLITLA